MHSHKLVLCTRYDVMSAMLTGGFAESQSNELSKTFNSRQTMQGIYSIIVPHNQHNSLHSDIYLNAMRACFTIGDREILIVHCRSYWTQLMENYTDVPAKLTVTDLKEHCVFAVALIASKFT